MSVIKKEQLISTAKTIGAWVIPSSTVSLATGLVRLVVPPGVGIAAKGAMCLGGIILGQFLGDKTTRYMDSQIDEFAEGVEETAAYIKERINIIRNNENNVEGTAQEA